MSQSITKEQSRAARALLDWSIADLANEAGIKAEATVRHFETGLRPLTDSNAEKVKATFARAGIEFIGDGESSDAGGGVGVRLVKVTEDEYLSHVPDTVQRGKYLVHNQVRPSAKKAGQKIGGRGARAWLTTKGEGLEKCSCDFAPHIKGHYRVKAAFETAATTGKKRG